MQSTDWHLFLVCCGLTQWVAECSDLYLYDGGYRPDRFNGSLFGRSIYSPLLGGNWAGGAFGAIIRDPGNGFVKYVEGSPAEKDAVVKPLSLFGPQAPLLGGRWAVGNGGLVLRDSGGGWQVFLKGHDGVQPDQSLYGPGAPLLGGNYAVGDTCAYRDSGAGWGSVNKTQFSAFGIARAGVQILACGAGGRVAQWDALLTAWSDLLTVPGEADLLGIATDPTGAFWIAVGRSGTVFVLNPATATAAQIASPSSADLYGVACLDTTQGWVVGAGGTIAKYTVDPVAGAVSWTLEAQGAFPTLYSIAIVGTGAAARLFAVGARGAAARSNGTGVWVNMTSSTRSDLRGVGGAGICGAGAALAAGDNGTLLVLNLTALAWQPVSSGTAANLTAVSDAQDTNANAFVVGAGGTVLITSDCKKFTPGGVAGGCLLRAVAAGDPCTFYSSEVAAAGSDGVSPALRLSPDPWHSPAYRLYCGGGSRRDFSGYYQAIAFSIRSTTAPLSARPTFTLQTYNAVSNTVTGGQLGAVAIGLVVRSS